MGNTPQANPSGTTAIALDGVLLESVNGLRAEVQASSKWHVAMSCLCPTHRRPAARSNGQFGKAGTAGQWQAPMGRCMTSTAGRVGVRS